jgi:hypothetical protein
MGRTISIFHNSIRMNCNRGREGALYLMKDKAIASAIRYADLALRCASQKLSVARSPKRR